MRSLAGSLGDGVLADTILIPRCTLIPSTDTTHPYKKGKGRAKKVQKLVTQKPFQ